MSGGWIKIIEVGYEIVDVKEVFVRKEQSAINDKRTFTVRNMNEITSNLARATDGSNFR